MSHYKQLVHPRQIPVTDYLQVGVIEEGSLEKVELGGQSKFGKTGER